MLSNSEIHRLRQEVPILADLQQQQVVTWLNPRRKTTAEKANFGFELSDMQAAQAVWERFAPFFNLAFPETQSANGHLESPLREIPMMKAALTEAYHTPIDGRLFLKCDNALPIVGSIKARGGFYEVLHHAETLALEAGILQQGDDYRKFASPEFSAFFSQFHIGVGSTGNLGLSIGTISAKLGFKVTVYMSGDAKAWKKELLRERGASIVEFAGDFSEAIAAGRAQTQRDPKGYFVDDENSDQLFLGYTVGALRLAQQLKSQHITVDEQHPLIVYSPCGVGGSPGGTAFGLKQIFGDHVHCFFVEPTHSPALLTGLVTGKMSAISVQDIGLDNKTEADGLAVGRPSKFATEISKALISGVYTVEDATLFNVLAMLKDTEDIFLEPSATAGLVGPQRIASTGYFDTLNMAKATQVVWATGGDLVPEHERREFYEKGKRNTSVMS